MARPTRASNGLQLPGGMRDVLFDFTALSFAAPEKVRFRVKLEGTGRGLAGTGQPRQCYYTNLPPKPYRFRVMAANNSGVWNEAGATLDFSIRRAMYQTNWFRALCVALVADSYVGGLAAASPPTGTTTGDDTGRACCRANPYRA